MPFARDVLAGTSEDEVGICPGKAAAGEMDELLGKMGRTMDQPQETM